MKKTVLKNGLRVLYKHTDGEIVAVNVSVYVGSNNEHKGILGISHFLEHMMFEGTYKRKAREISLEIERYGGEMNAYTINEKTNYYIKIRKRYAKKAIEILADMIINSTFEEKAIEKEKNVVIEEISMTNDEPRQFQWVIFNSSLYNQPYSNPVYGTKECVASLARTDLVEYHNRHYTPENTIVTVVGDCKNCVSDIKRNFVFRNAYDKSENNVKKAHMHKGCDQVNRRKDVKIDKYKSNQHYMIIGYKTPERKNKQSYILDIIAAILSKGQSGRLFEEIRTKRGLTYDVGIYHHPSKGYGFFAFYTSADKKKLPMIKSIFYRLLKEARNIKDKELEEAKSYIEGNLSLKTEDSQNMAEIISMFEECSSFKEAGRYIKNIKRVTAGQIKACIDRYLNRKRLKVIVC